MTIFERIQAVLTFRNGTIVNLDESSIISASIKRQCCSDSKFEIGGVYAASLSMKCRVSGTNSFRIKGAKIVVSTKFEGVETDFIPRGTFWITDAPRTGEIYSITAVDNVGWLDTANYTISQNEVLKSFAVYFAGLHPTDAALHTWLGFLTQEVNSIISRFSGLNSILAWDHYDDTANNGSFCNKQYHDDGEFKDGIDLMYYPDTATKDGTAASPRELYGYIAQIAGGFIYAKENGHLTIGQFGQKEFGTAQISASEIEFDSFEPADFRIKIVMVTARTQLSWTDGQYIYYPDLSISGSDADGQSEVRLDLTISENPFLDSFARTYIMPREEYRVITFGNFYPIVHALYNYLEYFHDFSIRPFRCRVHKPERFHLGQKTEINDGKKTFESVITSIQWTFRGGYTLSCGGEDARVLSGCVRHSKAEKSFLRCAVLENRFS